MTYDLKLSQEIITIRTSRAFSEVRKNRWNVLSSLDVSIYIQNWILPQKLVSARQPCVSLLCYILGYIIDSNVNDIWVWLTSQQIVKWIVFVSSFKRNMCFFELCRKVRRSCDLAMFCQIYWGCVWGEGAIKFSEEFFFVIITCFKNKTMHFVHINNAHEIL